MILAPIGAGGMGEVHKARDTRLRLDRVVAIKISAEQFSDGQRFLVNTQNAETGPAAITAVLNWTGALKK